ncbi:hypothetical protein CIRG_02816 [Coccidioides immitis RMSCC 2394]|uniref:Uncharacterized protein n=1 Tax=Coccidioides immitis RMSCC 2394 TaxID=404692 RepID=A0A0J6Y7U6_COCIT|nr:hypothetical protein CIRG_02816 [Coccidioides immitis RMSCC 2394]
MGGDLSLTIHASFDVRQKFASASQPPFLSVPLIGCGWDIRGQAESTPFCRAGVHLHASWLSHSRCGGMARPVVAHP